MSILILLYRATALTYFTNLLLRETRCRLSLPIILENMNICELIIRNYIDFEEGLISNEIYVKTICDRQEVMSNYVQNNY